MSIIFFVGRNGFGKTHAMVEHGVLPCWRQGRTVVSNISLYPEELGYPADLYQPLNEPLLELPRLGRHVKRLCVGCRQRCRAETCRSCGESSLEVTRAHPDGGMWSLTGNKGVGLVMDEITTMFPSRDSVSLPPELQRLLNQWRKPDIAPVMLSAPAWARADLMIRETCTAVVESEPWLPLLFSKRPPTTWGWPSHRAFIRRWYDPFAYEQADATGKWEMCPATRLARSWRPKANRAVQAAYDTFEGVELADHIACGICGGKTMRGSCKTPAEHRTASKDQRRQVEEKSYPMPEVPEGVDAELLEEVGLVDEAALCDAA